MGLNISDLFGNSSKTADTGMTDALQAGANAGLGYLEQQAINLISADKKQHDTAAQTATKNLLSKPTDPNGFSAYMSNLMQNPALQTYGPYIMVGVLGIVVLTVMISRK